MTEWISHIMQTLGYAGIALLAFLENVFPPIPSEVIMPLAGFAAAQGKMSLTGAILAGSAGSLAGCIFWYAIGRAIGEARLRRWIDRHGRWLTLDQHDLDRAQEHLRRHGAAVVFFGRLVPAIRTWISLPAGLSEMPVWKFLTYTAAGTVSWTALLTTAGYMLGANFRQIERHVNVVSSVVIASLLAWFLWRLLRQGRRRASES
jgi:membrane protein DedA with SNARE-associated domain